MSKPITQTLLPQALLHHEYALAMRMIDGVACVQDLEGYWLASTPFMAGDAISIADLLVIMELTQMHMLDGALKVKPCTEGRSSCTILCLVTD